MNILLWILFGLLVGIVTNSIDPAPNTGDISVSILLGVMGALLGGLLANIVFGITLTGFNFTTFLIAIAGSLLLLFLGKVKRKA